MAVTDTENPLLGETTCSSLLHKLQVSCVLVLIFCSSHSSCLWHKRIATQLIQFLPKEIWDEVGENDEERDKMLLQIEKECLDVYKRKVEQAAKSRAQLLQALSDAKIELASLLSALGEKSIAGLGIVSNYLVLVLYFIVKMFEKWKHLCCEI